METLEIVKIRNCTLLEYYFSVRVENWSAAFLVLFERSPKITNYTQKYKKIASV